MPVLAERFTVIAPDLRGHGDTEKPARGYDKRTMARDVIALMDRLGHRRVALIGHDLRRAPRPAGVLVLHLPRRARPSGGVDRRP
ncbi:alpha/beta fold hydrolase [Streptomyces yokosukanensis]|uniref:alpha/beta fold hydrolase n=1 Tax=Streptomyces yokosukanensis TaxID=67386 RepID=UPI0024465FF8|nr:alpha/beta fold hydrolase [Streptomyces yokosukanensis]